MKSFNVFLTYPFVDEVVGRDPQVARNLHMGDYTNLSIELDIDAVRRHHRRPDRPADRAADAAADRARPDRGASTGSPAACASGDLTSKPCQKLARRRVQGLAKLQRGLPEERRTEDTVVCRALNQVPGLPHLPGLPRAAQSRPGRSATCSGSAGRPLGPTPASAASRHGPTLGQLSRAFDPALVRLLVPGMVSPMITRRTRIQLLSSWRSRCSASATSAPATPSSTGWSSTTTYTVVAHFDDSGGIFEGGEVTYRGVQVGRVGKLELTDDGVDVHLDIENGYDDIPADTLAVVGNRSAVGEQYVELQPQVDTAPYLRDDSEIADGGHPHPDPDRRSCSADISNTVSSVDQEALADHRRRARARRSPAPARTCSRSSTPATPSSRRRTPTSTSPPP